MSTQKIKLKLNNYVLVVGSYQPNKLSICKHLISTPDLILKSYSFISEDFGPPTLILNHRKLHPNLGIFFLAPEFRPCYV